MLQTDNAITKLIILNVQQQTNALWDIALTRDANTTRMTNATLQNNHQLATLANQLMHAKLQLAKFNPTFP
jgi:hypothetical protein